MRHILIGELLLGMTKDSNFRSRKYKIIFFTYHQTIFQKNCNIYFVLVTFTLKLCVYNFTEFQLFYKLLTPHWGWTNSNNWNVIYSDPVVNVDSQERATVERLLQRLILEEDQFDVRDILPNTLPDPASLKLDSDYACPAGQVVVAPDCGK